MGDRERLQRSMRRASWLGIGLVAMAIILGAVQLWLHGAWFCSSCPYDVQYHIFFWLTAVAAAICLVWRRFGQRR